MSIERALNKRSNSTCELCAAKEKLSVFEVPPVSEPEEKHCMLVCETCKSEITKTSDLDENHLRCLNDSMWNEFPAVQVVVWRTLYKLKYQKATWANDLIDMMYLDEEALKWAEATGDHEDPANKIIHKDCNGNILFNGDSVVLIKDLKVKGGGFTAKRGEAVHRISLVHDNENHIEGRVGDQYIVIITQYVKKTK
ncbi:MAG: PhnA domain-containing protein [Flavobacteriaceae bacterium]